MYTAIETIPVAELEWRWGRCRKLMDELVPEAGGLLVFSRVPLYWFTGHLANGMFWLPREGEPVLLCRKGIERARMESPIERIVTFRSYRDVRPVLEELGTPLPGVVAVEMQGLPWSFGQKLESALNHDTRLVSGDMVLTLGRMKKSAWELEKLRLCGERHHLALHEMLPQVIRPGMTEREISHLAWEAFYAIGHSGPLRMGAFGEECFLGHVSAGDSGNYPSVFNGPVGLRGEHPAVPFMGNAGKLWNPGEPLTCDIGFCLEGYLTDKTQVYWAGAEAEVPDEVRRAHDFCIEVQARAAEAMVPGALAEDVYRQAVELAEKRGMQEGFMGLGANKVPFLGHGIGLFIDEFPPIANKIKVPFEEGMTMALEPKHGLPGLGMVGVENTFEVTPTGAVCITGDEYDMVCVG